MLGQWLGTPKRSPKQVNTRNEADCEIVQLREDLYLATTIDTLGEELMTGLYRDVYTIGWVAAAASLSDLAATGVDPVGVMLSTTWPEHFKLEDQKRLAQGFLDCCNAANVCLLGGDQNHGAALSISSVGIGTSATRPLMRSGAKSGDLLCLSGKVGIGPMMGIGLLMGKPGIPESSFRPQPQPKQTARLKLFAHAAIDLSDGLMSACFDLARASDRDLDLTWSPETIDPLGRAFCEKNSLPQFYNWLGEHGDFTLLTAIAADHREEAMVLWPDLKVIGVFKDKLPHQECNVRMSADGKAPMAIPYDWCSWSQRLSVNQMAQEFSSFSALLRDNGWP